LTSPAVRLGYNATHMRILMLSVLGIAVVASGCASDEREWMKIDGQYTTAEFRRDLKACTAKGVLDEECMKARGWVAVAPPKNEPKKEDPLAPPSRGGRRY
jgi:hypothetical protein